MLFIYLLHNKENESNENRNFDLNIAVKGNFCYVEAENGYQA